jgi:choline kinase
MKFIFLAAGKSKRIFNKIKKNKCLIKIKNKPLIKLLIDEVYKTKITDVSIITGFRSGHIKRELKEYKNIKFIYNKKYNTTEMLYSLILGVKSAETDIVISYSDILFDHKMINHLIEKKRNNITVPILKNWKKIWKIRNKDPLDDGETLFIDKSKKLISIGEKIQNLKDIKYQYMGLIFIPKNKIKKILLAYKKISRIKKMHASSFLNYLIKNKFIIDSIIEKKGWYEFDDFEDYRNYKNYFGN